MKKILLLLVSLIVFLMLFACKNTRGITVKNQISVSPDSLTMVKLYLDGEINLWADQTDVIVNVTIQGNIASFLKADMLSKKALVDVCDIILRTAKENGLMNQTTAQPMKFTVVSASNATKERVEVLMQSAIKAFAEKTETNIVAETLQPTGEDKNEYNSSKQTVASAVQSEINSSYPISSISSAISSSKISAPLSSVVSTSSYPGQDPNFYSKKTIFCTWINVWDSSTEGWWSANSSSGTKILYPGVATITQSLNWNDSTLQKFYMDQIKAAGVDAVIFDLTNGFRWQPACNYARQYAYNYGMKFSAAIKIGIASDLETRATLIWNDYANPAVQYATAYLQKDGKPVLVCYTAKSTWDSIKNATTTYASKFTLVWASGEDAAPGKWGWQVPAVVGPTAQASSDSMFVTPSINWTAPTWSMTGWRRHIAYLDYCFLVAKQNNPKYIIVSSYDDMRERNGWIKADTTIASFNMQSLVKGFEQTDNAGTPGMIMRDLQGNISNDAFYDRVSAWINAVKNNTVLSSSIVGGILKDGVYRMVNVSSAKGITSTNPSYFNPNNNPANIKYTDDRANDVVTQQYSPGYQQYISLYHLGNNQYRIVRTCIGMSLQANGTSVVVNWDSTSNTQRWTLSQQGANYVFTNVSTGKNLCIISESSSVMTASSNNNADTMQQWALTPIATLN